jgi:hypothetical protein
MAFNQVDKKIQCVNLLTLGNHGNQGGDRTKITIPAFYHHDKTMSADAKTYTRATPTVYRAALHLPQNPVCLAIPQTKEGRGVAASSSQSGKLKALACKPRPAFSVFK